MALKIIWTFRAVQGLENVIEYLEAKWTAREIQNLEKKLNAVLENISKQPSMFPETATSTNTHKALIDKNNYIIYRVLYDDGVIQLINFRSTRQNTSN